MRNLHRCVLQSKVGDDGYTECADAAVVCHDYLRHGAHAYSVATQTMIHLIFGRSLECRSLHAHVNTVHNADALLLGSLVHVREARSCGEVLAAQRMLREEVDVVCDDHKVADLEVGIHTA